MKLETVLKIAGPLQQFGQIKLPVKPAYRIAKNIRLLQPELEAYQKARNDLLAEHGTPVEGKPGEFNMGDNAEKFTEALNALHGEEVELKLMTVSLAELGEVSIEPGLLAALMDTVITEE